MEGAPSEVCEGEPITYTLTVANAGLSQAVNVSVSDPLQDGATLVSASGGGWNCNGAPLVLCTLPTLDVTTTPPLTIVVTAPAGAALNSASVGSQTSDVNGGNNAASASVTVLADARDAGADGAGVGGGGSHGGSRRASRTMRALRMRGR